MPYQSLVNFNIMEFWLFDTCNFHCGYCGLVSSGDVMRTDQLSPYRDTAFVDSLVHFFRCNRPSDRPWAVLVTGGEPTLMPNLERFILGLGRQGDRVAIYSNMSMSLDNILSREAMGYLAYVQASFHPDWYMRNLDKEVFFGNVSRARDQGVPILVRFVGTPHMLDMLPELEDRCKKIGVSFFPTTLFDPTYPRAYSREEKNRLSSAMVGYASLIQLDGGLLMRSRCCAAGDRLFAARIHKGGDITPCISVDKPVLGNIFNNTLEAVSGLKSCYKADNLCSCDVHFQQNIIQGVDDSEDFAMILSGCGKKRAAGYAEWKQLHGIETSDDIWVGQGVVAEAREELLRMGSKDKK